MNEKADNILLKVLIVDDSDFSRNIVSRIVTDAGHTVIGEAAEATSALALIKTKNPNVVITDIVMPEISGIELTEKITQNFEDISVIVISSLSQEHIILDAIAAGACDFISKPIYPEQLKDSLDKIKTQFSKI